MPNAFGPGGSSLSVPLYDPRPEEAGRARFRRDKIPELAYANSIYIPGGKWPSRGWILLRRSDLNLLPNLYSRSFSLYLEDFRQRQNFSSGKITLKNLSIVQARCVSRGIDSDANAIYLVELTDPIGILYNRWFQYPTTSQYNLRSPAYPDLFYENTTDAGAAWDWSSLVGDLWTQMGTFLGPYPGLPIAITDRPEGWTFTGCSAWEAMVAVLNLIGLEVATDLTQDNPYTIVQPGAADATYAQIAGRYSALLEDDMEWIDVGAGRVPKEVVVYFRRRNQYYGTEETVRRDGLQWVTNYVYPITVAAPAQFSAAQGTHYIWSDFTVRYDVDNNPLAADVATAATVAASETAAYFNRVYRNTLGYLWQLYGGLVPFATGSQVDGVCFRQDFRDYHERQGWLTEITRGPQPPWPMVEVDVE